MNLRILAVSALLAVSASASFGQEEAPAIGLVLTPSAPNTLSATFQRPVTGLFLDTFEFTPAAFSGLVSVSLTPVSGPINFFAALLNDEGFGFFPESGQSTFAFQSTVASNAPLTLQVFGFAGDAETLTGASGVYSGTINAQSVSAIPEPETYALMMVGLGVVGFVGRRRKTTESSR